MTVTASSQGEKSLNHAHGEQLIPGISNEITLEHITTKMPWREFQTLSLVSRRWLSAIGDHQVYDARVRSRSTDALVLVIFSRPDGIRAVSLYSLREKSWIELPPIPDLERGIPYCCQCVSLDGKVYVVGGLSQAGGPSSDAVYMLDIACQRLWKKCASMREPRSRFGCGVLNGKIYVFGGMFLDEEPGYGSEVYDPKENVWSQITPMKSLRFSHRVEIVGEELFLHDGWTLDRDLPDFGNVQKSDFLDAYHTVANEWRQVKPFGMGLHEVLFVAKEKIYSISEYGIRVLDDMNGNSWTHVSEPSLQEAIDWPHIILLPFVALAVDDELLAIVSMSDIFQRTEGFRLVQSRGFQSGNRAIVWETVEFPRFFGDSPDWYRFDLIHPIQL